MHTKQKLFWKKCRADSGGKGFAFFDLLAFLNCRESKLKNIRLKPALFRKQGRGRDFCPPGNAAFVGTVNIIQLQKAYYNTKNKKAGGRPYKGGNACLPKNRRDTAFAVC